MEGLKHKLCLEKDDLKDAGMFIEWAEDAKEDKDDAAAAYFFKRAQRRWEDYINSKEEVRREIERHKGSGHDAPDSIQAALVEMLMSEQKDKAERVKKRIESFSM
jgi:hypothetical protein